MLCAIMTVRGQFCLTHIHPKYQKQQYDFFFSVEDGENIVHAILQLALSCFAKATTYSNTVIIPNVPIILISWKSSPSYYTDTEMLCLQAHWRRRRRRKSGNLERRWDKSSGSHPNKPLQCTFLSAL